MSDFKFYWESISLTVEKLVLQGALDRSIDPETNQYVAQLQSEVRNKSSGKIIIIDLAKFGFWDTEGIRAIVGTLVQPLVEKSQARIGFCGPKYVGDTASGEKQLSQLYEDAKIKYAIVGSSRLPWEETVDATLKRLTA